MADIGCLPSKTTVRINSSNGDHGTLPGATPAAAGCMTAEHAKQLATLWAKLHDSSFEMTALQPIPADAVSRSEVMALLTDVRKSKVLDLMPLQRQLADLSQRIDTVPTVATDETLRQVLSTVIEQVSTIDDRLRRVESVIDVLRDLAALKAQEAALP